MAKYILPKISNIIFIAILISVFLLGPVTFNLDGDLGRHITIGSYILDKLSIPTYDIFSHTKLGEPLTPHEWLSQVVFAMAHKGLSLSGAVLVTAIVIAGAFSIVYYDSVQRSEMPVFSLILTTLAAAAASIHWLARPHIFTFLFLALWAHLLEQFQQNKKISIWAFGSVMLLWANIHGAFIAGFVVLGAYIAGCIFDCFLEKIWNWEKIINWLKIGAFSFLVTLLNPDGIYLWKTSLGFVGNTYLVSHTAEYLSANFHMQGTWPFLAMLLLSTLILSFKRYRLPTYQALLLAGWLIMALYSTRNIPLFVIVVAPILADILAKTAIDPRWRVIEKNMLTIERSAHGILWPSVSIILAFVLSNTQAIQEYNAYDPSKFPVKAVDWMKENPQDGRMFNYFPWGGYLLYREWPHQMVFIDGQTDFYGEALTREYEQVISLADNWYEVFEKHQINIAIIPTDFPLEKALSEVYEWNILYKDDTSTILVNEKK